MSEHDDEDDKAKDNVFDKERDLCGDVQQKDDWWSAMWALEEGIVFVRLLTG